MKTANFKNRFKHPALILVAAIGIILMLIGTAGWTFTYTTDHRSAESLSAYCDIDFRASKDRKGNVDSIILTIQDYRFSSTKLKPQITLYIDGAPRVFDATAKQVSPTYELSPYDPKTSLKNMNKLFIEIPPEVAPAIKNAESIDAEFEYLGEDPIRLPLNAPDLSYWKNQVS